MCLFVSLIPQSLQFFGKSFPFFIPILVLLDTLHYAKSLITSVLGKSFSMPYAPLSCLAALLELTVVVFAFRSISVGIAEMACMIVSKCVSFIM